MKTPRVQLAVRLMVVLGALLVGVSSCRFLPTRQAQDMRGLFLPAARASVLVIIVDQRSPSAIRATGALVDASARPRERIVILSSQDGTVLASSQAPASPTSQVPAPPAPLRPHSTSFQQAGYRQAVRGYQTLVRRARLALRQKQQQVLQTWARSLTAKVEARPVLRSAQTATIGADLGVAISALTGFRQAGLGYDARAVIAVIGIDMTTAVSAPAPPVSLQSSTVAVGDFAGTVDEQAAWQAGFMQNGAARAVILTPATGSQLATVVEQGLDGAVTDTLTSVLFGLGQYHLQAAALPQLRHLLHLLTVAYPDATATINGYTDSLPAQGGNLLLSQRRAQAVTVWLTTHGVAAGRLQAFGYGDTDPAAPDTSQGQPLNRRVVAVIDPAVSV
jgi:outer membrane protein OmpA-like peptidoglycan-associated protein